MEAPTLTWSDVWLLRAVHAYHGRETAPTIEEILAAADGINHAVMTYAELTGGAHRLEAAGLLNRAGEFLTPTAEAERLFHKHRRLGAHRLPEALKKELGVAPPSKNDHPHAMPADLDPFISRDRFDAALETYRRRWRKRS
ncbi:MAG: hypothetical protein QF893_05915 [Alphaproteobacteria bacterium]|jgi:hypothetical protein|nr:hypothetical protein [Alphaproteobacteria bacterium]